MTEKEFKMLEFSYYTGFLDAQNGSDKFHEVIQMFFDTFSQKTQKPNGFEIEGAEDAEG